jgi:hypothetical protein
MVVAARSAVYLLLGRQYVFTSYDCLRFAELYFKPQYLQCAVHSSHSNQCGSHDFEANMVVELQQSGALIMF